MDGRRRKTVHAARRPEERPKDASHSSTFTECTAAMLTLPSFAGPTSARSVTRTVRMRFSVGTAARRFFRRLLKSQRQEPVRLVTDKLGSYRVAHRDLMPLVTHDTRRYANNRAEVSHQPTRQRERQMRGFTSSDHAQRFLHVHGVIQNLFRVGRHLLRAAHHRMLRARSFTVWAQVTAA